MLLDDLERPPELCSWSVSKASNSNGRTKLVWGDGQTLNIRKREGPVDTYIVDFVNLARFEIDFLSKSVGVEGDPGPDRNTLRHLLVDQIFPRILAHQGKLVVHASAVRSGSTTLLFAGPSGVGKSTLASSFYAVGWDLLGDDAIMVENGSRTLECRAVYQSLRLFDDSFDAVLNGVGMISPVASYTSKRNVNGFEDPTGGAPQPLSAIVFLAPDHRDEPAIDVISPAKACMGLIEHSFWLDPSDGGQTLSRLQSCGTAAGDVPAFQLSYPRRFDALAQARALILRTCAPSVLQS